MIWVQGDLVRYVRRIIQIDEAVFGGVLSTLVHEQAHLWQHHFGKPGRGRYHNREWAAKMVEIGLIPSATGEPGGKQRCCIRLRWNPRTTSSSARSVGSVIARNLASAAVGRSSHSGKPSMQIFLFRCFASESSAAQQ
jgi:hypothetical protein